MDTPPALAFGKRLVTQIMDDDVPDLAAGLAYRFLFALFPFAIFLAALAGFVAPLLGLGDPTNEIMGSLADNLPPDVANQIRPQLEAVLGEARPGLMTIGALTALWAAAGGIGALINSMNKAYDVEDQRNFFVKTGVALALTVVGSVGILVAFVTIVGGSILTQQAVEQLGITESLWTTISLLRFPVVLLLVAVGVAVLFKLGPNVRVSFKWTFVGGVVFSVSWLLATLLFALYVANFANYANTYGALGGVVILMLWFYLTGLMLLVAAEVTALLAKSKEPERIEARRQEIKAGAARTAGVVAGAAVGAVKAGLGTDGDGDDRAHRRGRDRERGSIAPRFPRPATASAASSTGDRGPNRLIALAIMAAGAVTGAVLARIAGDDDEGAAAT